MTERKTKRRTERGIVQGDPRQKTIAVVGSRMVQHPKYRRYIRRESLFRAHDEKEEARAGDTVEIMECRPISKTKHWRLVRVIARRAGTESEAQP